MEEGTVTSESEVTLYRLQRRLASEEPDILAVDSLQEVAADQSELFAFIQALPPSTRLVQVTGGERKETLQKVAARYNISVSKTDPYAEARAAALIASSGGGAEVIAFENSCDITVSRHRSIGKGGWSQNRYIRKIHGSVLRKGREIESALSDAGLKFEKKEYTAFGGASRVQFRVYASRDMVPVRTSRGPDVQVRISGRRLDRIRFKPLSGKPRYLIAGIDPGTTIGIAAIDLDGNLMHLISSRQMTMSDVIEELYRIGKPLIVASDVHQMPFSVEKIRRAFNAVAYTPRHDRSIEEKWELTKAYGTSNDHERDALSAALDAYRQYRNKFQNISKRVPPGIDLDEVRAGVIRGKSLEHILGSREETVPPAPPAVQETEEAPPSPVDERVMELDGLVKRLRGYIDDLSSDVKEKDAEIERLGRLCTRLRSEDGERMRRDAEIARRDATIRSQKNLLRKAEKRSKKLNRQVSRLKRFADLQMNGDHIPVKVLDSLTRDAVRSLNEDLGINEGDIIAAAKTDGWGRSVLEFLHTAKIRVIIAGTGEKAVHDGQLLLACSELELPFIPASGLDLRIRGRTGTVPRVKLDEALVLWERDFEAYRQEKKTELLESIFREYRSEREREVRRHG